MVVDTPVAHSTVALSAQQRHEARQIANELAKIARSGKVLPGSLSSQLTHCGRPGCRCMADPPRLHGPYWHWTRKVAKKTVGRWWSKEQADDYQTWLDNGRRLKELVGRLESLGIEAAETDPRNARRPSARSTSR